MQVLTRAQQGCVVHRCQNKNPRTRGCEWRHAPEVRAEDLGDCEKVSWVESCRPKKKADFRLLTEARPVALWRVPHVLWGGGRWKSPHKKNVYHSPYVEETLNSKVIKNFVPELRSRKCFSCFKIPMFYVYMLWTFYVRFAYPYLAMIQVVICFGLVNLFSYGWPEL